jgi:hypothetical protein
MAGRVRCSVPNGIGIGSVPNPSTKTAVAPEPAVRTITEIKTETVTVSAPAPPAAKTTTAKPAPPVALPATIPGEGTFVVGTEVKPGTYRTAGSDGINCYWARLSGLSGSFGEILANGNVNGPTTVTIRRSDKGFETTGCAEWRKVA